MARPEARGSAPLPDSPEATSLSGCLLRAYWIIIGNAALAFSAMAIAMHRGPFLSVADAVFWGAVVTLAAARLIDIRKGSGRTASGEPATMANGWRYVLALAAVGIVVWGAAHAASRLIG